MAVGLEASGPGRRLVEILKDRSGGLGQNW